MWRRWTRLAAASTGPSTTTTTPSPTGRTLRTPASPSTPTPRSLRGDHNDEGDDDDGDDDDDNDNDDVAVGPAVCAAWRCLTRSRSPPSYELDIVIPCDRSTVIQLQIFSTVYKYFLQVENILTTQQSNTDDSSIISIRQTLYKLFDTATRQQHHLLNLFL